MNVLLVTTRYPWPALRGDQLRAVQQLEMLAPEHRVTLLAPEPAESTPEAPALPQGCRIEFYRRRPVLDDLAGLARCLARSLPLQSSLFYSRRLGAALRRLAPEHDLVILQLVRLAPHRDDVGPTPILVDLIDSLALNFRQWGKVERGLAGLLLRWEARRLERWEVRLVEDAAAALVVSERDRQAILEAAPPGQRPALEARLVTLPLAFPLRGQAAGESLLPEAVPPSGGAEPSPPRLALTGNLGYFVTVDGLIWWLDAVWPRLRRRWPDLELLVAGARPARRLRRACRRPGVQLIPSPPDLEAILRRATVAIAPMRCGAGQPLKILEAWQSGIPVLATPWAAAGTTAHPGQDLAVAETPEDWETHLATLLEDQEHRDRLRRNAQRRLQQDYDRKALAKRLGEVVASAVGLGGR